MRLTAKQQEIIENLKANGSHFVGFGYCPWLKPTYKTLVKKGLIEKIGTDGSLTQYDLTSEGRAINA